MVDRDALFSVQDHGVGISPEDKCRLFQAFSRGANVSNIPGTGLGLVIVKRCVSLLGGAVSIESSIGAGTIVTVRLPLFDGQESETTFMRRWREQVASTGI
jgi:signal transduction histidine kinase